MGRSASAASTRRLTTRIVVSEADFEVAYLARLGLRLSPVRRRQLVLLAECLLQEDEITTPAQADGWSEGAPAPDPVTRPSLGPGH
jgi:hypothetical protein